MIMLALYPNLEYLANQEKVTKLLKKENWHHTEIKEIKIIQSSEAKVHFVIHFVRLDKDSKVTHDFKTLWIVTKINNHWGVQFRSSFLTSKAATFWQKSYNLKNIMSNLIQ